MKVQGFREGFWWARGIQALRLGFRELGVKGSGHKNLGSSSSRAQQFRFSGSKRSGSGFGRSLRTLE